MKNETEKLFAKKIFKSGEKIYVHKSTSVPEYVGKMHKHNFIEISYIVSGSCTHIEFNSATPAKKGDLFIINYGVPHVNIPSDDGGTTPFLAYDCAFLPSFLNNSLNDKDFLDLKTSLFLKSVLKTDLEEESWLNLEKVQLINDEFYEIELLFKKMLEEYEKREDGYYDLLRAYLVEILIKVFRQFNKKHTASSAKNKQENYIKFSIEYIVENYDKKITLDDMAYRSFLSKSYFSKLFKEHTGSSFSDFLQSIRVKKACELLLNSDLPITDVCYKVGFNDVKFFYKIFKKIMCITPKEFREQNATARAADFFKERI